MKESYSFEGSDLVLASLLRNVKSGNYVDVGANHPTLQNNTNYFYQIGWRGIAIDGNEEFASLWSMKRPEDVFISSLVSSEEKEVDFFIYPDNTISSIDNITINRYSTRFKNENITVLRRKTTTLFNLRDQYFREKEIHILSVDVEGEDLNCLIGAELQIWTPGVIVVECKNMSLYKINDNNIFNYLNSIGYKMIAKTPLDAFFIFPSKEYFDWVPKTII